MCGIVGFTGNHQAAPILLDGLSKLEYRGYDSAGLAVRDGEHLAQVVKAKGRLSNLSEKTDSGKALKGTCGIGHTRWATLILVTVHSVHSNLVKIHSKSPSVMGFCPVCLGILPYSWQNTSRDITCEQ